ncbi:5' methyl DNA binding protein 2/3-like protein [Dirofilaria immitis]|nr:5' methyl DNA binding protein 2/3-like protein [Dirofilaria immitis]
MGRTKGSEAGNLSITKRGMKGSKDRGVTITAKSGFDGPLNAPWRKTVSIFKQPVTLVHTTSRETKNPTNEQLRRVCASSNLRNKADKPRQLYWAKALENLCAMVPVCNADRITIDDNEHIAHRLDLAGKMEPALGIIGTDGSAASLCSALHGFGASVITGQTATKNNSNQIHQSIQMLISHSFNPSYLVSQNCIEYSLNIDGSGASAGAFAVSVSEQDIQQQERRVLDMRKRLQEARKHFHM